MNRLYRKAQLNDIDEIMICVEDARSLLKEEGNGQWQFGYPNRDDFLNDIKNGVSYVVLDEATGEIAGVCALTYYEEEYENLYEGSWLSNFDFMVMHRVAVKEKYRGKGFGKALFEVFILEGEKQGFHSLRIDTHKNNTQMVNLCNYFGFTCCGKVILKPNKDRVVFEKII